MFYVIYESSEDPRLVIERLRLLGCDSASYYHGGWHDKENTLILPYISFENNDEACLHTLTYGGRILKEKPSVNPYNG